MNAFDETIKRGWSPASRFPVARLSAELEKEARARHQLNKQLYGHRPNTRELSNNQWIGEAGELIFRDWLFTKGEPFTHYSVEEQLHSPDFLDSYDMKLDTKTRAIDAAPDGNFVIVNGEQYDRNENTDLFWFLTYDRTRRNMWIVGWYPKDILLSIATWVRTGDIYRGWRCQYSCWCIDIDDLRHPLNY